MANRKYMPRKHFHNVMINPHFSHRSYKYSREAQLEKNLENMLRKAIYSPMVLSRFCITSIKRLLGKSRG